MSDQLHEAFNGTEVNDWLAALNVHRRPWEEAYLFGNLLRIGELLNAEYNARLDGLNVKRRTAGWLVVVTVTWRGRKKVAFQGGETMREALGLTMWNLQNKLMDWKDSKY